MRKWLAAAVLTLLSVPAAWAQTGKLQVLAPIERGGLTIFPVVGGSADNVPNLLTLDEGLRDGTVLITEKGMARNARLHSEPSGEVNRLVLVNNSGRPLLLLAGEVVTGGKQDRVIGVDTIVPPHSKPLDLSVFCVEHGRWTSNSDRFGSLSSQMVQPSVRLPAMADKSQQGVWDNVAKSNESLAERVRAAAPALRGTSSYAQAMAIPEVRKTVSATAGDYQGIREELRRQGARGVVVAIHGRVEWADIFGNEQLLQSYWEKLIRSYAAEAVTSAGSGVHATRHEAQAFLDVLSGTREVVETQPGVYRRTETSGAGYKVFTLTSLLGKQDASVHVAKMRHGNAGTAEPEPIGLRRR